jgi:hypothetical protein
MGKDTIDITVGDLLAQFDRHLLYLLERRYLDHWHRNLNHFVPSASRTDWRDSFCGVRLEGIRHFGEAQQDLALANMDSFISLYRDGSHSFICAIDGTGGKVPEISFLSCGTRRNIGNEITTADYARLMQGVFKANFPGAQVEPVSADEYTSIANSCYEFPHAGMMTGIPGRKMHEEEFFVQGLDRFFDITTGADFVCLIVAEPYSTGDINSFVDPVLELKNELGELEKINVSETETITNTKGTTTTVGAYMGRSVTDSVSSTMLEAGSAVTAGAAATGVALGTMVFPVLGTIAGGAVGAACGTIANVISGLPITETISRATSMMGGGFGALSRTRTRGESHGKTVTREAVNYAVRHALEKSDEYLSLLRNAKSYGMWDVGFYIFAKDRMSYTAVKDAAISCFSGEMSGFEPLRVIDLEFGDVDEHDQPVENDAHAKDRRDSAISEIVAGFNPRVEMIHDISEKLGTESHPLGACFDGLGTPMSTSELAIMVAPPQRENRSISVTPRGAFAGKVPCDGLGSRGEQTLTLGRPLYYGEPQDKQLKIPVDALARHAFVTGITGAGKTNTIQNWCRQLSEAGIPWLVIEPGSKREYRNLLADEDCSPTVFSLGTEGLGQETETTPVGAPFRINPFYFEQGTGLLPHLDALKAAFNASFPMYASMPYILEEAIVEVYRDRGSEFLTRWKMR